MAERPWTDNEAFGELREIVHATPTRRHWEELCALMDAWPDPQHRREVAIPYALDHVDDWPVALRQVPLRWREALLDGHTNPALRLATTLKLGVADIRPGAFDHLLSEPHLDHLLHCTIDGWSLGPEEVERLAHHTTFSGLEALMLTRGRHTFDPRVETELGGRDASRDPEIGRILGSDHALANLRQLGLDGWSLGPRGIAGLTRAGSLPQLTALKLTDPRHAAPAVRTLCEARHWSMLGSLDLSGCPVGNDGARAIAAGEHGWFLRTLRLARGMLGGDAVEAMVHASALQGVSHLDIGHNIWVAQSMEALAEAESMRHLESLRLGQNNIGDAGLASLCEAPTMEHLAELRVPWCDLTGEGVWHLARSPVMRNLRVLDLNQNPYITPDSVRGLSDAPVAWRLEDLRLCGIDLSGAGEIFGEARFMGQLRTLYLVGCGLEDGDVEALAAAPQLARLRQLRIDYNRISDRAMRALARSVHLRELRSLYIGRNRITSKGLTELVRSPVVSRVRELYVAEADMDDAGVEALAESAHLAGLRVLDLSHNPIGERGLRALATSPHLAGLHVLRLQGAPMSNTAGMRALQESETLGPWIKRALRRRMSVLEG